jgi:hypothetical protein
MSSRVGIQSAVQAFVGNPFFLLRPLPDTRFSTPLTHWIFPDMLGIPLSPTRL